MIFTLSILTQLLIIFIQNIYKLISLPFDVSKMAHHTKMWDGREVELYYEMSQRTTKPTIRLVWPAKIQISLHICTVWSLLIACAFYSLWDNQRRINKSSCHTGWMYRLIWVFVGHKGQMVGFVVRWLKWIYHNYIPLSIWLLIWKFIQVNFITYWCVKNGWITCKQSSPGQRLYFAFLSEYIG